MKERLQKIIAAAGICSRRAAEDLLRQGRVQVNGQIAALGDRADPETDAVTLDGQPLSREPERVYLMLNKPRAMSPPCPTSGDGGRRRSWCPAAAHGCTLWGGWTWTPRVCC